ncbi:MAG: gliding motility-associated C-terminal domain-containing protein [Saprospiraceae bacterium]|nr:gliding motility-associated C-terminal domain-containing protein [Saprospiraceae bacterium]
MKKLQRYTWLSVWLSCFFISIKGNSQVVFTNTQPNPGLTYDSAPIIDCWLFSDEGYSSFTYNTGILESPFNFCGTVENPQWLAFTARDISAIQIRITTSFCSNPNGLQAGIYEATICHPLFGMIPKGNCVDASGNSADFYGYDLTPNKVYYIFIDGYDGSICDYHLEVIQTTPAPPGQPYINGPGQVFGGQTYQYQLVLPDNFNFVNTCNNTIYLDTTLCPLAQPCEGPPFPVWTAPPGSSVSVSPNGLFATVNFGAESGLITVDYLCLHLEMWVDVDPVFLNCDPVFSPANTCEEAPIVCSQDIWCGNNAGAPPALAGNLPQIINCSIDRTQWLLFAPCESTVTVDVTVAQCNNAMGLSFAVLSTDDCQQFSLVNACQSVSNNSTQTLTFSNLIPGEMYYLYIAGNSGDACDYAIEFVSGVSFETPVATVTEVTPGYIDGPSSVCLGETATYTLVLPVTEFSVTVGSGGCALPAEVCNSSGDTITFDIVWHAPPGAIFVSDSVNVLTVDIMFNDTIDGFVWVELVPNIIPGTTPPNSSGCNCITAAGPLSPISPTPVDVMYNIDNQYIFLDCNDPFFEICGVTYFFTGSDVITCQVYCGFEIYHIFYDDTPIPNFLGVFEICTGECVEVLGQNYCSSGSFNIITFDGNCLINNIFQVVVVPPQVNNLGTVTLCPGDCFSFAGSDYCQAGNYDIPGIDPATGCPNSTIFTVVVNPPNADVDLGTFELCEGQCVDVLGQNYCASGTYSVTTYDAFGCPINNIFQIIISPTQVNDLGAFTLCPGDCFSFAGLDYCQAGSYDIPGVDPATGCPNSTIFTILIEQPQQIDVSLPVPNCNPVTGNYAVSFYMSGTPPFFVNGVMTNNNYYLSTPISSGEAYYFQIYDSSPCNALTPVLLAGTFHCGPLCLSQTGPMNAGLLKTCADQIAMATPVSNYTVAPGDTFEYVLHTAADTTLGDILLRSPTGHFSFDDNVLDTGQTYYLSLIIGPPGPDGGVDTASPCLKVAKGQPLVFKALPQPVIDITEPTCYGRQDGAIQLSDITLPYTLQINNQTTQEEALSQLSAGDYHLALTDENGCQFDTLILIGQPALVIVDIGEDRFISVGESVSLQAVSTISPVTAVWNSNSGEKWEETLQIEVRPMQTTVYTLLIADENGCEATDALTIQVKNEVGIYVPNAFSPNNDGINDGFTLFGKAEQIDKIVELLIFDRWGELVFHKQHFAPNDELLGWDGNTRGKAQSQGVYVYHATVELAGGRQLKLQGEVGLVR